MSDQKQFPLMTEQTTPVPTMTIETALTLSRTRPFTAPPLLMSKAATVMAAEVERLREQWDRLVYRRSEQADEVRRLTAEVFRLGEVEAAAQTYVMAGLCGNPDTSAELHELIRVARTDGAA